MICPKCKHDASKFKEIKNKGMATIVKCKHCGHKFEVYYGE